MSFTEDIRVRPHFCFFFFSQSLPPQHGNCKMDQEMLLRVLCTLLILRSYKTCINVAGMFGTLGSSETIKSR